MNEKRAYMAGSILVADSMLFGLMAGAAYMQIKGSELASSFTHYSDSTWTVDGVLHWVHEGDTVRLDISKFR